jgi:uroporphyrin-III C-methyltransferase
MNPNTSDTPPNATEGLSLDKPAPRPTADEPESGLKTAAAKEPVQKTLAPPAVSSPSRLGMQTVVVALAAVILATVWLVWANINAREQLSQMQQTLAQRLSEGDESAQNAFRLAKDNQEEWARIDQKLRSLDDQVGRFEGERIALEALHHEFLRSRDERLLAEVEQTLTLAMQQLAWTGNVETALLAMTSAYQKLSPTHTELEPLRQALGRDIERLQALPLPDTPGLAARLSAIANRINTLPMAHEESTAPVTPVTEMAKESMPLLESAQKAIEGWRQWLEQPEAVWAATKELARDIGGEIRGMVRLERLDQPITTPLSPEQGALLRENLKIRLLLARFALLAQDPANYRHDLEGVIQTLESRFDRAHPEVQTTLTELWALLRAPIDPPQIELTESVEALRVLEINAHRRPLPAAADAPSGPLQE